MSLRKSPAKIKAVANPSDLEDPHSRSPLHEGHLDMRRKTFTLALAVVFVCLFASRAQAQQAAWDAGFPKPGNNAGEILVQGTSTPSGGSTLTGSGSYTVWLKGGGTIVFGAITVNAATGNWSGTITGLQSGKTYNVVIGIFQKDGTGVQSTISPDPKQSQAK
jgi:uncharacterized protein (DUF2147 family)